MKNQKKKIEEMSIKSLHKLALKVGVGYNTNTTKEELIELLKARKAKVKAELEEAKEAASLALGKDFFKAVMFWKKINNLEFIKTEDYAELTEAWLKLTGLLTLVDKDKKYVNLTENPTDVASALLSLFGDNDDFGKARDTVSDWKDESECRNYILEVLKEFNLRAFTERISKDNYSLKKICISDIRYDGDINGKGEEHPSFYFDKFFYDPAELGNEKAPENGVSTLLTSEDGLSRILQAKGIDTISVLMDCDLKDMPLYAEIKYNESTHEFKVSKNLDEWIKLFANESYVDYYQTYCNIYENNKEFAEELWNKGHYHLSTFTEFGELAKHLLIREGFTSEGKHYMPAIQSASSTRQATITFMEVKSETLEERRKEVMDFWLESTGFKKEEDLIREFCNDNEETNIAKFIARLSMRGSNSFSLEVINPEIDKVVRNWNVKYVADKKTFVKRTYKTFNHELNANSKYDNILSDVMTTELEIVDGDGQGLISFTSAAYLACALRRISKNELLEFLRLWDSIDKDVSKVKIDSKLDKLIKKIPSVFQIRHGEKKGILVRWNLEAVETTKDIDCIIPNSVRKFHAGEWNDYSLEICNFLKAKKDWAYLNPQFISALEWDDPKELLKVCQYWKKFVMESVDDISKAQQFHGLAKSDDEETDKENATLAANLKSALFASSDLIDDFQIIKWRREQYEKFIDNMKIGRIMVPGMYTYMIFDPAYLLNKWFDLELSHLNTKEFYHNGKTCEAMLARSPLIAPFEAQKVQLVNNDNYRYLKDTVVFNGYDGTADKMGGGDHDGDMCEIVSSDSELGKIVVDGIRPFEYEIWKKGGEAKLRKFNWDNLVDHWATVGSTKDRTGPITNYATKALDIANHLKSCIKVAEENGCETITLLSPNGDNEEMQNGLGWNFEPKVKTWKNGKKSLYIKGLKQLSLNYDEITERPFVELEHGKDFTPNQVSKCHVRRSKFDQTAIHAGVFTFEQLKDVIQYYKDINLILRLVQGDEIDGAKTGFYPEIPEFCQLAITPWHMLERQAIIGRDQGAKARANVYKSFSPSGFVYDFACDFMDELKEKFSASGRSKVQLLKSLLTKEETEMLYNMPVISRFGNECDNLIKAVTEAKNSYGKMLYERSKTEANDQESFGIIKEKEANLLREEAEVLGVTPEVMAAACYIATYSKQSDIGNGLSYAWLLFDELLSVFSRGNKKFELFRMPKNVESAYIKDGYMFINEQRRYEINAEDTPYVVIQIINGNPYALIQKRAEKVVVSSGRKAVCDNKVHYITAVGMKYHITKDKFDNIEDKMPNIEKNYTNIPVEDWKSLVMKNNFTFDVVMGERGNVYLAVQGYTISSLNQDFDSSLVGTKVKMVNRRTINGEKIGEINYLSKKDGSYLSSIYNIAIQVIGEADLLK